MRPEGTDRTAEKTQEALCSGIPRALLPKNCSGRRAPRSGWVPAPKCSMQHSPSSQRFSLERLLPSKGSSKMDPFSLSLKVCRYMALFSILPLPAGHEGRSGEGWSREHRIPLFSPSSIPKGNQTKPGGMLGMEAPEPAGTHRSPHIPPGCPSFCFPPALLPFPGSSPLTHAGRDSRGSQHPQRSAMAGIGKDSEGPATSPRRPPEPPQTSQPPPMGSRPAAAAAERRES